MSTAEDPILERPPALPGDGQEPIPAPPATPAGYGPRGTMDGPPDETYPWDEVLGRLREKADRGFPAAWVPQQPGAELIGIVRAVKPGVRTPYGPVPVLEIVR